jgi:hypothetical protein
MRGKIDKNGFLWKEVPGGKWIKCDCVNWACSNDCAAICRHDCAPFEGPLPERRCTTNGPCGTETICDLCHAYTPTGRTLIKICQGRELVFDEFVDERVPK